MKNATNAQLAKLQNDQKVAMKKFKEEHDKLEEWGRESESFACFKNQRRKAAFN